VTRSLTVTEPNLHKDAPRRALRVLVVDDDRDTVLSLITLLRTEAYEVRGLYEAGSIERHVQEFDPDVVILDIAMPGKNGWVAAREIRSHPGRRTVLIGISGEHVRGSDRTLSEMNGFDFYLMKPYDPNVLMTLLRWVGIQSPYRSPFR
jgi:DNA-binding response OmpR family regulator